jgi:two-component system sensor kinase FixL
MTASLAHELNQPLTAIVNNAFGALQYLEQDRLDARKLREILEDMFADGRRATEIMQKVRSAIKKGTAIRGPVNLNDVVTSVAHMVHPDAAASGCRVETALATELPLVHGDPTQLQQVLINLIHNAFEAMQETPPEGRAVEIATSTDGIDTVEVAVRDYGSGIATSTQERLFEQFFTTKDEGLGMGLAIVRSIVEAHDGTIAAENVDGRGARFYLQLPAAKTAAT